jgi:hypothetical protein
MKQITREHLERSKEIYENNEARAWSMVKDEKDEVLKASLIYQANKTHGMVLAIKALIPEQDITVQKLYEVKDGYEKEERELFATSAIDQAAEARGSKEAVEELIFVMTGSFPELR